jgi:hypothetical protein
VLIGILSFIVVAQNVSAEVSNTTLSSADRQEIMDLIYSYSYAYDSKDLDGWLDLFTDDAIWSVYNGNSSTPNVVTRSNEERRLLLEPSLEGNQTRHFMTNTILNQTDVAGAEGMTMYLCIVRSSSSKTIAASLGPLNAMELGINVVLTGYYQDKFVKTQNGWKFASREAYEDSPIIKLPDVSAEVLQRNI